jgi:hypothetical protein
MERVRLNIIYDAVLQKNMISSNDMQVENDNAQQYINKIYFVICNSCYWCATFLTIDELEYSTRVLRCHNCNSHNTERIPISSNEAFRMKYSVTGGMEMEFYRTNEIVDKQESPEQQIVPV